MQMSSPSAQSNQELGNMQMRLRNFGVSGKRGQSGASFHRHMKLDSIKKNDQFMSVMIII